LFCNEKACLYIENRNILLFFIPWKNMVHYAGAIQPQGMGCSWLRALLGVGWRCSYNNWLVKLNILPVPCMYIFSLIMIVFNHLCIFKTKLSLHDFHTGSKNQLHFPSVKFTSVEKGVTYSAVKYLIIYPQVYLNYMKIKHFKSALRKYLFSHARIFNI
jgi:hypothetical protein